MVTSKQFETKPFWQYAFPIWDGNRVESIIGVVLHYLAILVFIPLSIFHNLHAIDHLQGLPYVWLFGLACVIDLLIAILLGVAYEFFLSLKLILHDQDLKKAFDNSASTKKFLLGSLTKNVIVVCSIILLMICGTIFLSLKGGFNHAETSAIQSHKPQNMSDKKQELAQK